MLRTLTTAGMMAIAAVPAHSAVVSVVIDGYLSGSSIMDENNLFGGAFVNGAIFRAQYIYDTSVGTRASTLYGADADVIWGDRTVPNNMPISGTMTIGGITHEMAAGPRDTGMASVVRNQYPGFDYDLSGSAYIVNAYVYDGFGVLATVGTLELDLIVQPPGVVPASLDTGYSTVISATPYISIIGKYAYSKRVGRGGLDTSSDLSGTSIKVTCLEACEFVEPPPAPVPLPATAGLMILGLGAITGLRMRRRTA